MIYYYHIFVVMDNVVMMKMDVIMLNHMQMDHYVQIIESWSGSSVSFDESSGDGVTWSYEREALQVALDDGGTTNTTDY